MMKQAFYISFAALIVGGIACAWYNGFIMLVLPGTLSYPNTGEFARSYKKQVILFFPSFHSQKHETKTIVYSKETQDLMIIMIQSWLTLMEEEKIITHPLNLQSAALSYNHDELIISFDRTLFDKQDSIAHKLKLIHALLKTITSEYPSLQKVHFLSNHAPLVDDHLDFSRPWPAEGFENHAQPVTKPILTSSKKPFTLVIHPSGDSLNPGRTIYNTFERTYTLNYAQYLKNSIEKQCPQVKVIITRSPGALIKQEQAAELANKLQADFYIVLNCHQTKTHLPLYGIYYLTYHPGQSWKPERTQQFAPHECIPVSKAHLPHKSMSQKIAAYLNLELKNVISSPFNGIPCLSLKGVICPAIMIEIGIPADEKESPKSLDPLIYRLTGLMPAP